MKKYIHIFLFAISSLLVSLNAHAKKPDGIIDEDNKKEAVEAERVMPLVDIEGFIANEWQAALDAIPGEPRADGDNEADPVDPAVAAIRAYHIKILEEMANAEDQ